MIIWKVSVCLRHHSLSWLEANTRNQGRNLEIGTEAETLKELNFVTKLLLAFFPLAILATFLN